MILILRNADVGLDEYGSSLKPEVVQKIQLADVTSISQDHLRRDEFSLVIYMPSDWILVKVLKCRFNPTMTNRFVHSKHLDGLCRLGGMYAEDKSYSTLAEYQRAERENHG